MTNFSKSVSKKYLNKIYLKKLNFLLLTGYPCKSKNCRYCPKINHTGQITSKTTNRSYCSKICVDYCITCSRCNIQYVGQTKKRLIDRFGNHFYNIIANIKTEIIGRHFNLPDHKGLDTIKIHIHPHGRISQKLATPLTNYCSSRPQYWRLTNLNKNSQTGNGWG